MSGRIIIMRPKLFIAAAGLSLLLAYPVSQALTQRDKIIQSQQRENNTLQIKLRQFQKPVVKPTATPVPTAKPTAQVVTPATPVTPTPVATPAPVVKLASFTCQNYSNLFSQYNWDAATAMAICQAESGGNPNPPSNGYINYDGVSDYGLMQLHGIAIVDPALNISYAYYHKYLTQGWGAWSTYNSGKYRQYL